MFVFKMYIFYIFSVQSAPESAPVPAPTPALWVYLNSGFAGIYMMNVLVANMYV